MFLLLVCGSLDWMKTDMIKNCNKKSTFQEKGDSSSHLRRLDIWNSQPLQ